MTLATRRDQEYADGDALIGDGAHGLQTVLVSEAGWELFDAVDTDPGEQDLVFKSDGEGGDQAIYLRLTHIGGAVRKIYARAYSLWDADAHEGYNEVGDPSTCILYRDAAFDAWVVVNKDHLALVIDYDGGITYNKLFAGLVDTCVPLQQRFAARLGPPIEDHNSEGDDKLRLVTGTTISNLQEDQYLWVVSQGPSYPSNAEKVRVDTYDAPSDTIFLANPLENSYAAQALVGLNQQEVILWGSEGGQLSASTPVALHSSDAYESINLSWTSLLDALGVSLFPSTDYNTHALGPTMFYDLTVDQKLVLGTLERVCRVSTGAASAEDWFTAGSEELVCFPDDAGFLALKVT